MNKTIVSLIVSRYHWSVFLTLRRKWSKQKKLRSFVNNTRKAQYKKLLLSKFYVYMGNVIFGILRKFLILLFTIIFGSCKQVKRP